MATLEMKTHRTNFQCIALHSKPITEPISAGRRGGKGESKGRALTYLTLNHRRGRAEE